MEIQKQMKVEEVSEDNIKLVEDKELYDLAIRVFQLYTRYVAIERSEQFISIKWDIFFSIVDYIKLEFSYRNISIPINIVRIYDKLQGLEL